MCGEKVGLAKTEAVGAKAVLLPLPETEIRLNCVERGACSSYRTVNRLPPLLRSPGVMFLTRWSAYGVRITGDT